MYPGGRFTLANRALVSAGHEKFDFSPEERKQLAGLSRKEVQGKRPPTRGLLIIYTGDCGKNRKERSQAGVWDSACIGHQFPEE